MALGKKLGLGLLGAWLGLHGCVEQHPDFVFVTDGASSSGGPAVSSSGMDVTTGGTEAATVGTADGDSGSSTGTTGDPCPEEECNGVDDDCDDEIDEGCDCIDGETEDCFTGGPMAEGVGICETGTRECADGQWGVCEGEVVPTDEACNSLDDDCDGDVDEDFGEVSCGEGVCMVTVELCQGGVPQECTPGEPLPAEECNGFDDDCNGQIDEIMCECLDGEVQPCYSGPMGTDGIGECVAGLQTCVDGAWGTPCMGDVVPAPEVCDLLDNDCDGIEDEGDPGGGGACLTGVPGVCSQGTQTCEGGVIVCDQTVMPSAEVCDGFDNDCDTGIDEGNPEGGQACSTGLLGECGAGETLCQGGVLDCDQVVLPVPELCNGLNDDCDGATDEGNPEGGQMCSTGLQGACGAGTTACNGGVLDCNQTVFPAGELCNGVDDDCDGAVDDGAVGGGLPCPTGVPGVCAQGVSDCSGGAPQCNQTVFPSAETCNGLDDDCDTATDEGNPGGGGACNTGQAGVCGPGTLACSGGALVCNQNVASSAEVCDGLDNDCDAATDDGNPGGGANCSTGLQGVCGAGTTACSGGAIVCNQNVASSAEVCDALDNDCDGVVDDGNPGGGGACNTGLAGPCSAGTTACSGGGIVCNQLAFPVAEVCNGVDDDCDGVVDDGNPGGGGACNTGQAGVCGPGTLACSGGALVCNANVGPSAEICDGLDNDCDTATDEGNPGGGLGCSTGLAGVCGPGTTACSGGGVVCNPNVPASPEACDDLDNDCDGLVDDGDPGGGLACSTGQLGVCAAGTTACAGGGVVCNQNVAAMPEICGNGLDDDCNGVVENGCPTPFGSDNGYTGYVIQGAPLPCDDILATGTPTGLTDDSHIVVPLGFSFPVYGVGFNNVTIESNGALHFDTDTYLTYVNECLPTGAAPTTNNVYVLWEDLNPSALGASEVYYQTLGPAGDRRFVVQWETAFFGGDTVDLIRVQAMLSELTGQIDVCYVDTLSAANPGNSGGEATAGIQQDPLSGFQYSCFTPDLTNGTWLQYVPF